MSTRAVSERTVVDEVTVGDTVLVERRDHTMVITINRPDAANAINLAVSLGVGDALAEADGDPEVRCVVLTASGDRAFCAGADLKAMVNGEPLLFTEGERAARGFAGWVTHHVSVPTIVAVNGIAYGGGFEIVLASDLVVSADHASFGLPEVRRGIIAGAGGPFRLADRLPRTVAMELLFTGEPISASRAHALHLVNRVVPGPELLDTALELAASIATNAPLAVQATKRVAQGIDAGTVVGEVDAWRLSARERADIRQTNDAREGPWAFAEKRQPVWTGT